MRRRDEHPAVIKAPPNLRNAAVARRKPASPRPAWNDDKNDHLDKLRPTRTELIEKKRRYVSKHRDEARVELILKQQQVKLQGPGRVPLRDVDGNRSGSSGGELLADPSDHDLSDLSQFYPNYPNHLVLSDAAAEPNNRGINNRGPLPHNKPLTNLKLGKGADSGMISRHPAPSVVRHGPLGGRGGGGGGGGAGSSSSIANVGDGDVIDLETEIRAYEARAAAAASASAMGGIDAAMVVNAVEGGAPHHPGAAGVGGGGTMRQAGVIGVGEVEEDTYCLAELEAACLQMESNLDRYDTTVHGPAPHSSAGATAAAPGAAAAPVPALFANALQPEEAQRLAPQAEPSADPGLHFPAHAAARPSSAYVELPATAAVHQQPPTSTAAPAPTAAAKYSEAIAEQSSLLGHIGHRDAPPPPPTVSSAAAAEGSYTESLVAAVQRLTLSLQASEAERQQEVLARRQMGDELSQCRAAIASLQNDVIVLQRVHQQQTFHPAVVDDSEVVPAPLPQAPIPYLMKVVADQRGEGCDALKSAWSEPSIVGGGQMPSSPTQSELFENAQQRFLKAQAPAARRRLDM